MLCFVPPHCHIIWLMICCVRICCAAFGGDYGGEGVQWDGEGKKVSIDWSCTIGVKLVKLLE